MTPPKRRPITPATQGPPRAATKNGTQQAPTEDAAGNSAAPTETGHVDAEDRPTKPSSRRPLSLYPLPVWPD